MNSYKTDNCLKNSKFSENFTYIRHENSEISYEICRSLSVFELFVDYNTKRLSVDSQW